jgi:hypothetical protein
VAGVDNMHLSACSRVTRHEGRDPGIADRYLWGRAQRPTTQACTAIVSRITP